MEKTTQCVRDAKAVSAHLLKWLLCCRAVQTTSTILILSLAAKGSCHTDVATAVKARPRVSTTSAQIDVGQTDNPSTPSSLLTQPCSTCRERAGCSCLTGCTPVTAYDARARAAVGSLRLRESKVWTCFSCLSCTEERKGEYTVGCRFLSVYKMSTRELLRRFPHIAFMSCAFRAEISPARVLSLRTELSETNDGSAEEGYNNNAS